MSRLSVAVGPSLNQCFGKEATLSHLLMKATEVHSGGIITIKDDGSENFRSYGQLYRSASMALAGLQRAGLRARQPVLLLFKENDDFLTAFWACILGGMIPVPLSYLGPVSSEKAIFIKIRAIYKDLQSAVILSDQSFIGKVKSLEYFRDVPTDRLLTFHDVTSDGEGSIHLAEANEVALIQYSSGSTGHPKGVVLRHRNLVSNLEGITRGAALVASEKYMSWMPYSHDMGLIGFHLTPVALGALQINMSPVKFLKNPTLWLEKIHQHRCAYTGSPNFGYRLVLQSISQADLERWDLSCLKLIFNGAEPISVPLMRQFCELLSPCKMAPTVVYPVYGMAEACLAVTFPTPQTEPLVHKIDRRNVNINSSVAVSHMADETGNILVADEGLPVPGCEVRVVNSDDTVVVEGVIGHVQIRGANVTSGYYGQLDASTTAFQEGWLRTGDLGFMSDGRLCITGRHKDVIFSNGQNFFAHDIEAIVEEQGLIQPGKCCVTGWHDAKLGAERVAMFAVIRIASSNVTARMDLCRRVWRRVAEETGLLIDYVVPVKSIPRTTSGKLQRYQLLEDFLEGKYDNVVISKNALEVDHLAIKQDRCQIISPLMKMVRAVWAEVLDRSEDEIQLTVPFLSQGGTSLKAVQVLGKLEERTKSSLNHDIIVRCKTVTEMAAYLETKQQSGQLEPTKSSKVCSSTKRELREDIAIIGHACRLPDAATPEQFWENILHGRNSITTASASRWNIQRYPSSNGLPQHGGFIKNPYAFDADFFGIADGEAAIMDPQQRLFLEVAWETLESAGYAGRNNGRRIGVFVGASYNSYMEHHYQKVVLEQLQTFKSFSNLDNEQKRSLLSEWEQVYGTLPNHPNIAADNLLNMIAARTSHFLNIKGPSLTIDTACSSSLVAVHLACESIRLGECDMAIAGGVNLILSPTPYLFFGEAGVLSPTGLCRVFDEAADGFVPGEGAGAVMLKPLKQSVGDGDNILAVIKGSSLNNDGRSLSVMAPNPEGQRAVIEEAYRKIMCRPSEIQYIETHGTGTPIGDPSEVRALAQVFSEPSDGGLAYVLGSVKANIGHLLSAAGIASLLKVILSLKHRKMPPSTNLSQLNPLLNLPKTKFRVLVEAEEWNSSTGIPRRAAINSFGFGGTNCHLVIEEAPTAEPPPSEAVRPLHLLCLSARSASALQQLVLKVSSHVSQQPDMPLEDLCFSYNYGRAQFSHRTAVVGRTAPEIVQALNTDLSISVVEGKPHRVALMFTGQGAQYHGMARDLYEGLPSFRSFLDECAAEFDAHLSRSLLSYIFDPEVSPERLKQTDITQPATFALDYALGKLLLHWGVRPTCLLGHSIGEYVAACLSGILSLKDAVSIVANRGILMNQLQSKGSMAAIFTTPQNVHNIMNTYKDKLWIAAYNGTHHVVAGDELNIEEYLKQISSRGWMCKKLQVSHAFHTPLMLPVIDDFRAVLRSIVFHAPTIPIISNITAEFVPDDFMNAEYWEEHISSPVCFEQSLQTAIKNNVNMFIECGPSRTLAPIAQKICSDAHVLHAVDRRESNWLSITSLIERLYRLGVPIAWDKYHSDFMHKCGALPTYPFQRKYYGPMRRGQTICLDTFSQHEDCPSVSLGHQTSVPEQEATRASPAQSQIEYTDSNYIGEVTNVIRHLMNKDDVIDIDANFHDLGITSVSAVELAKALGVRIGRTLHPTLLFEHQSIRALSSYLAKCSPSVEVSRVRSDAAAVVDCQSIVKQGPEYPDSDIAIIGMSCRLPGADTVAEFWKMLLEGTSSIREVPSHRWAQANYFQPDEVTFGTYSKWGAFLADPYAFDPLFFGISPREAVVMDPQQRLFLQVAWEALQQSGYGGQTRRPRETGVFVGCEQNHYGEHYLTYQHYSLLKRQLECAGWMNKLSQQDRDEMLDIIQAVLQPAKLVSDAVAGNELNQIPARLSHWLNINGPSFMVNTACSSSLVALHLACESLRRSETDLAIVGGVYLTENQSPFVFLSQVKALSPTGSCTPFDKRANGMVLGEGAAAIVLKPLKKAMIDKDHIYAVVKGSAVNNDGHSTGLTAPNPRGQADVISKAYRNAGINLETVSYIECHGTSTALGDPVEVEGMTQAFRSVTTRRQFCGIGSVKSSIGHLLSAAGIPSIIKVALAMKYSEIPPTVNYVDPNPHIDFEHSPFYVVSGKPQPWKRSERPRRAGVNAFGFGGTNCHVVIEEAPLASEIGPADDHASVLLLAARTPATMEKIASNLKAHLERHRELTVAEVCLTMNGAQRALPYKTAIVIKDRNRMVSLLDEIGTGRCDQEIVEGRAKHTAPLCLIFDSVAMCDTDSFIDSIHDMPPHLDALKSEVNHLFTQIGSNDRRGYLTFIFQWVVARMLREANVTPEKAFVEGTGAIAAACMYLGMNPTDGLRCLSKGRSMSLCAGTRGEGLPDGSSIIIPGRNCLTDREQLDWVLNAHHSLSSQDFDAASRTNAIFLHVGGSSTMRDDLGIEPTNWVSIKLRGGIFASFLRAIGELYVKGVAMDACGLIHPDVRRHPLPTYPFDYKSYHYTTDANLSVKPSRGTSSKDDASLEPRSNWGRQFFSEDLGKGSGENDRKNPVSTTPHEMSLNPNSTVTEDFRLALSRQLLDDIDLIQIAAGVES